MAKQPETVFKERIRGKLNQIPQSWWVKTQMLSVIGIPDLIGCLHGRFVALELKKSSRDKAKPIQKYVLKAIQKAGGYARVCHPQNWEKIYEELLEL